MGAFDLDGVFDEDDYLHFYFGDQEASDAASDLEAGQVASLLQLQPGMRVLDAPSGHGRIAQRLAQRGCVVVGIDRAATSSAWLGGMRRLPASRSTTASATSGSWSWRLSSTPPSTGSRASATSTTRQTATSFAATTKR
jgi:hypothetical protein